jgi:hypothetical protein
MSAIKETPASVEAVKEDVVAPTTIVEPTEGPQTIPVSVPQTSCWSKLSKRSHHR